MVEVRVAVNTWEPIEEALEQSYKEQARIYTKHRAEREGYHEKELNRLMDEVEVNTDLETYIRHLEERIHALECYCF